LYPPSGGRASGPISQTLIHFGTGNPGTGTYGLTDAVNRNPGDGDWVAAAYHADNGQLPATFAATSGSVKVTRADDGTKEYLTCGCGLVGLDEIQLTSGAEIPGGEGASLHSHPMSQHAEPARSEGDPGSPPYYDCIGRSNE
jgi:hypothetical protein